MTDALLVVTCYLLGSIVPGVIVSRARGMDVRERDLPGASGIYRQLGPQWGVLVLAADIAKGLLAGGLAILGSAPWTVPLCGLAVVAGHLWPAFFNFRGGGGIATALGFLLVHVTGPLTIAVGIGLLAAGVYYLLYFRRKPRAIYPLPFGSIFGFSALLWYARHHPIELWAVALIAVAIFLRGLAMLRVGTRPTRG